MSKKVCSVLIGIPSLPVWSSHFALSLFNAGLTLVQNKLDRYDQVKMQVFNKKGSILPQLREGIFLQALEIGADFLIFVDSDQAFPANTFYRLVNHNKSLVAANVAVKRLPSGPTARKKSDHVGGDPVYTDPTSKGLEQVWRIGCGVMCIRMADVKHLAPPRFQIQWREGSEYVGEDWHFCQLLEDAGIPIYIDHDLSKHVGHVGELVYTHDMVGEMVREEV